MIESDWLILQTPAIWVFPSGAEYRPLGNFQLWQAFYYTIKQRKK